MTELSIGEVARRAGVRPSALRYYEQAGILPAAKRVNGRRHYSEELVKMIEVARFAQSVGFSLAEVKQLFAGFEGRSELCAQWRPLALAKLKELDAVIEKARRMKGAIESGLSCGCIRVQDCLPRQRAGAPRAKGGR
jgi:MerR family transcriptional regulator, redox-sensitive transcriptional activator SoxR